MINKKIVLAGVLLIFVTGQLSAQTLSRSGKERVKFHVALDYHYNYGIGSNQEWVSNEHEGGHSLHLTALYDFASKLSAGVGIGADRYTSPDFNTFPIYGTVHYRPLVRIPQVCLYTNLGYGCFSNEAIAAGWVWDLGIGYTKMFRKHFGLNFQLGYNLKEFAGIPTYELNPDTGDIKYVGKSNDIRHSLSLGIGLVF